MAICRSVAASLSLAMITFALPPALCSTADEVLQEDVYIIGPGDILELKLFDASELSGQLEVLNDGSVPLPLVGSVNLRGLTLQQATLWIRGLMSKELLRPDLQLRVIKPRPIRVALVGQVERPGIYSLTPNETGQTEGGPAVRLSGLPTLVDAIQKAGGIAQQANLENVVLQRRLPGTKKSFNYKQAHINLLDLVLKGDQTQNPFLFDGDTISLSKANDISPEATELAAVNLSPKVIEVNVIGEVENPGRLQLKANTPLVQAVLAAGGSKNWRANSADVELIRINRNGSATLKRFRLNLSEGASNESNPPLRDGDSVKVNRNNLARASDAISAVSQPLGGLVQIWTLFRLINSN
jgi:polysaccharide export outer membrane protein